jgi:predicted MFS family arabinose efflux permease
MLPGSRYVELLRADGVARPVLFVLVGRIPDSIAGVAIIVLVRSATRSYSAGGLAAGGFAVGSVLAAPLTGRALDRFGQRTILPALAGCFAVLLTVSVLAIGSVSEGWVIAMLTLAGLARPPLESAMRALWPGLVAREDLDLAYSLDSTLQELIWIAGPLMLSLLLAFAGPKAPLLACAGLSVLGTLAYATSQATGHDPASRPNPHDQGVLFSAKFSGLLIAATLYGVSCGMLTLALTAACASHGHSAAVGVLIAVWGIGSIVGGIAYSTRRWSTPPQQRAVILLAAFGALLALTAAAPTLATLAATMLLLGLPLSPWLGTLSTAVQQVIPASRTTEAFTYTFAVITTGIAAGNALGGLVIQQNHTSRALLAAAAAALAGSVAGSIGLRHHRTAGEMTSRAGAPPAARH